MQPTRAPVVGADRTVQFCSSKDEVDHLQINDPWAQSSKQGTRPIEVVKSGQDPIEQIEKRVVAAVLAKMPRDAMEIDSTPHSEEVEQRIANLESKVQQLHDGQHRLHHVVQEQTVAQARLETKVSEGAEQLQSFQTQFRAQLEQQQGQLDSLFQQQMSKIEEILKRPRRE